MNGSVVKLGRDKFLLSYVVKGKMYKMIITPRKGPAPVLQVINDAQEDVTREVLPYMGPRYDWHHIDFYFQDQLGSKQLIFELDNGEEVVYRRSRMLTSKFITII